MLLVVAGGCGLGDYEAKIKSEQERLRYVDRINQFLGLPILPPPKKENTVTANAAVNRAAAARPAEVPLFLRPPKGIASKYEDQPLGNLLFRYLNKSAGMRDSSEFREMDIGISRKADMAAFRSEVLLALPGASDAPPQPAPQKPFWRDALRYDKVEYSVGTPPMSYYVFFHKTDSYQQTPDSPMQTVQIAIVFQVPADKVSDPKAGVQESMNLCLQTLGIGLDANRARALLKPPPPPPPPTALPPR